MDKSFGHYVKRQGFALFKDVEYENISSFCSYFRKIGNNIYNYSFVEALNKQDKPINKFFIPKKEFVLKEKIVIIMLDINALSKNPMRLVLNNLSK